ncbi:MAG TPA: class I SAM-dependent methyltransferase [Chloroflexota bacterium]|nr:class I SAM-dependent methyltransferase [Chloroflexota bacterium]
MHGCPRRVGHKADRRWEPAIGTGRIGLPLAAREIRVDGIDSSSHMVGELRAKPGGNDMSITMGIFADVAVDRKYRLIYVIYSTHPNLGTQEEQVQCFENVAVHLTDDGLFVVEAGVMDPMWLANHNQ